MIFVWIQVWVRWCFALALNWNWAPCMAAVTIDVCECDKQCKVLWEKKITMNEESTFYEWNPLTITILLSNHFCWKRLLSLFFKKLYSTSYFVHGFLEYYSWACRRAHKHAKAGSFEKASKLEVNLKWRCIDFLWMEGVKLQPDTGSGETAEDELLWAGADRSAVTSWTQQLQRRSLCGIDG